MGMLPRIRGGFLHRGERAQTTTEFVVVFPMLLLLFFLMLEFGWLLKNWVVVTNGPREAARCAIANNCKVNGSPTDPETLLLSRINAGITGNLTDVETDVHFIDTDLDGLPDPGESIVVCVRAGNKAITPLLVFASMANVLPDPMPLAAREEMIIEFVDLSDPLWSGMPAGGENCVSTS
jgi:hypothetical protein